MNRRRIEALAYFLTYAARRYWRDEALDLASSLAYTSLLAMVPMLAIGLGILGAFPGVDSLRHDLLEALFKDLVPQVGSQVEYYMGRFAANAGRLTVFGAVGLVLTAMMLLIAIEGALNRIFRVAQSRATTRRIIVYWAALTLGPLLAGAGLTMSAWFAVLPWVRTMHHWAGRAATAGLRDVVTSLSPFVVMGIAFTALFLVTPNRRVRMTDALAGGLVAALLVLALRSGFGLYIALWGTYRPVYGAVAAMPIFLAWVYLSWTAVLFGAEIAAALPERRHRRRDPADAPLDARRRLTLALAILATLARDEEPNPSKMDRRQARAAPERARPASPAYVLGARQRDGRVGSPKAQTRGLMLHRLTDAVGEGERPVAEALKSMIARGLAARRPRNRFGAGDALATATLADLLQALDLGLAPLRLADGLATPTRLDALLGAAARAESEALQCPLQDLLDVAPVSADGSPSPLEGAGWGGNLRSSA